MENRIAKPFLKWAGGKTQMLNDIKKALPKELIKSKFTYIEPFVGSGAVLFWMLENFPNIQNSVINDINEDLINTYRTIAAKPNELISILQILQNEFHSLDSKAEEKKEYYYKKRELYNTRKEEKNRELGVPLSGRAFRFNLLFVPHKRISTAIPNAKLAA